MARYHGSASFALPYTLHYLAISIKQSLSKERYIPISSIRPDWIVYGGKIKSAESFSENLAGILKNASNRGEKHMVMTFATNVPENYTPEKYDWPLERWGLRENVLAAVFAHNKVIRSQAQNRGGILFQDMDAVMSDDARYFVDPCHLSETGSKKFVKTILAALLP